MYLGQRVHPWSNGFDSSYDRHVGNRLKPYQYYGATFSNQSTNFSAQDTSKDLCVESSTPEKCGSASESDWDRSTIVGNTSSKATVYFVYRFYNIILYLLK